MSVQTKKFFSTNGLVEQPGNAIAVALTERMTLQRDAFLHFIEVRH